MALETFVEISTSRPFWLLVVSEHARARKPMRILGVEFSYERALVADVAREHGMSIDESHPGEIRLGPGVAG